MLNFFFHIIFLLTFATKQRLTYEKKPTDATNPLLHVVHACTVIR